MKYRVEWEIDIDADTPEDAALEAYAIILDPASTATVFSVTDENDVRVVVDTEGGVATVIRDERKKP